MKNKKSLKTLEYDKIIEMVKTHTSSFIGKEYAEKIEPECELDNVNSLLELTSEAESMLFRTGAAPVDSFPDMRNCLKRIKAALYISTGELLNIARNLRTARSVRESIVKNENDEGFLINIARNLSTYKFIEDEISRCIISEDEIFDGASPALSKIRKQMRQANEKVREKLNSMIRSTTYQKYLQDPIITVRNGRFVIPVKQEYRQYVPGLIHDQSGSGATLFIEPTAVVELGNEYKKLVSEEAEEIERILTTLTDMIKPYSEDIYNNSFILGEIDVIFAKAVLSKELRAVRPKLNDRGYIKIVRGRHPLIASDKVVPIDV